MKFTETWNKFWGKPDEREEIENNKMYARAFIMLTALILFANYFAMQFPQLASVHHLDPSPYQALSIFTNVIFVIIVIPCVYICVAGAKKGFAGAPRFDESDTFPWSFALIFTAGSTALVCLAFYLCRCAAEVILVGASNVFWLSNIAVALFFAPPVFILVLGALYLHFRDSKKYLAKLMEELED